jgi:hypothetical protein
VKNFIECVKTRQKPVCEIQVGHDVALVAHMGNIAYRTGNKLYWDEGKNRFKNDAKADSFLKPGYRSPWKFPEE